MHIGYIGLGKMGASMVERLTEHGHIVVSYSRSGSGTVQTLKDLVETLPTPRTIWIMVPSSAVDSVIDELVPMLSPNDTVIDGGNSHYTDTIRRAQRLGDSGFHTLDVGVSGGPSGARNGACLMVGGERADYDLLQTLWNDLSVPKGHTYTGTHGSGHFVKMVHNGIEYGMMQSIAEGFAILKASPFGIDLTDTARIYNTGSVIESRLTKWLYDGFMTYGEELADISSTVTHTGEGAWTVEAAKELGVAAPIIEGSLKFREDSGATPSYTGKVVSMLRNMFGGHDAKVTQV